MGGPVSLVRAPDGVGKQTFFQKHAMKGMPEEIKPIPITESDGKPEDYLTLPNADAIVSCGADSARWNSTSGARATMISNTPTAWCSISIRMKGSTFRS